MTFGQSFLKTIKFCVPAYLYHISYLLFPSHATIFTLSTFTSSVTSLNSTSFSTNVHTLSQNLYVFRDPYKKTRDIFYRMHPKSNRKYDEYLLNYVPSRTHMLQGQQRTWMHTNWQASSSEENWSLNALQWLKFSRPWSAITGYPKGGSPGRQRSFTILLMYMKDQ